MDLISKSVNRIWFWFVETIVLQQECVTTQHSTAMCTRHCLTMGQQEHITGSPYRVCFVPGLVPKNDQIQTCGVLPPYFDLSRAVTMSGHTANVIPLYIWRNEVAFGFVWGGERNYSGQESQKCKCIHRHTWCKLPYICSFSTNNASPSGCILNFFRNSRRTARGRNRGRAVLPPTVSPPLSLYRWQVQPPRLLVYFELPTSSYILLQAQPPTADGRPKTSYGESNWRHGYYIWYVWIWNLCDHLSIFIL